MTTISERQNRTHQIMRLAAQRQIYSTAKRVLGFQMIVAGPVAILAALVAAHLPNLAVLSATLMWCLTLTDVLFLSRWQKRLCEEAAKVQEEFDCEALLLPWNALKVGQHPDPELIKDRSDRYQRRMASMPTLRDWYSTRASDAPLHIGRVACQRSNCWWDSTQRARYAFTIRVGLALCGLTVLLIAIFAGLTVESALKGLLLPLGPAIVLSFRQLNDHIDATTRAEKLKDYAGKVWTAALRDASEAQVCSDSRALQDEIFEHRKRSPLIFDFVFRRMRTGLESQMNYGVDDLIRQYHEPSVPQPNPRQP